jgi:hypothetical protein
MGPSRREVDVSISWSPEHPVAFEPRPRVTIDADFAPVLEEASRVLKQNADQAPVELVGVVVGLRRPEGAETGRATLVTFIDGRPKTVTIELAEHYYDIAIQAHQMHRTIICEGVLMRMGRATILIDLTDLRLASEAEEGPEEPLLL